MQARIEKLGEDKYVLKNESDGKRATVPMRRQYVRALVLEAMHGHKVDLLLDQTDRGYGQQVAFEEVAATVRGSSKMGAPSPPVGTGNTDFVVTGDGAGESQEPGPEDLTLAKEESDETGRGG